MENQIPFLKADAVVPVEIGTGFVQRIQQVLHYLIPTRSEEEIKDLEDRLKNNKPLEEWMQPFLTITTLLNSIEKTAEKLGMIEYRPIQEIIPSAPREE